MDRILRHKLCPNAGAMVGDAVLSTVLDWDDNPIPATIPEGAEMNVIRWVIWIPIMIVGSLVWGILCGISFFKEEK